VDGAGSTWTNNGSLYIGDSGAGTLDISNGGAVVSTGDGILGANAGSDGSVTVDGAGSTLTSTGIQVGSGGDGTLVVSNGGSVSDGYSTIGAGSGSSGAVTVDGAGSTWTSTVELRVGDSGSGTLNISNGGLVDAALLAVGLDGGQGAVVIGGLRGGVLQAPGTLDAPAVNLYATGSLVFQHSDTTGYSFDPQIAGTGALEQVAGTTILTADSGAFTGATSVSGGVLRVNGSIGNSAVTITGGVLGGTGTVGDLIAEPGGTVAPGNSIGTLNVAGDVGFSAGSTYQVEVNAAGQSDLIAASGAATIKGGAVDVLAGSGNYVPSTQYTILTADGGLSGTFDSVSSNFAFLAPTLTYDEKNVYLELDRNGIDFDTIGGTPNERAAGRGVQSLDPGSAIYGAVLSLDIPSARAAFDALSGEAYASAQSVLIEDSRFVREAATDRLRDAFDAVGATLTPVMSYAEGGPALAPATTDGLAVWTRGFGAWGSWNSDGNAARLDRSTGGLFMGADVPVGAWRFGVLTGYSYTSFDVKDRGSSGTSQNYHLGVYGGAQWGNLALRTGAAYTWHDLSFDRSVGFQGFSDQLAGSYSAGTAQAFAELGYGLHAGNIALEPFADLAYVSLSTGGFTERGGAAALKGGGATTDATFTTLGVHASTGFDLGGIRATARGTLGWRHAFGDTTPDSVLSFAGGSPFSVAGVPIAKDVAVIDAGLDLAVSRSASLGLSYNGQFGSGATDQGVRADFSMKF
jgi:outer membrane autotransporter protein